MNTETGTYHYQREPFTAGCVTADTMAEAIVKVFGHIGTLGETIFAHPSGVVFDIDPHDGRSRRLGEITAQVVRCETLTETDLIDALAADPISNTLRISSNDRDTPRDFTLWADRGREFHDLQTV